MTTETISDRALAEWAVGVLGWKLVIMFGGDTNHWKAPTNGYECSNPELESHIISDKGFFLILEWAEKQEYEPVFISGDIWFAPKSCDDPLLFQGNFYSVKDHGYYRALFLAAREIPVMALEEKGEG